MKEISISQLALGANVTGQAVLLALVNPLPKTVMLETDSVAVPVFLVSSLDEADLAVRAADVGATGWISKTAGIGNLAKKVNAVLKKPS